MQTNGKQHFVLSFLFSIFLNLVCIYFVCSYYIAGRVFRSSLEIESIEFSESLAYYVCVNLVFLESRQMEQVISKRRGVILCLKFIWSLQSHRTVGSLWRESGLNWIDFLPEGEDIQAFISQQVGNEAFWSNQQISVNPASFLFISSSLHLNPRRFSSFPQSKQKLQLILSDGSGLEAVQSKRILSPAELSQQLERLLLEDMATDEQIFDWVEVWRVARGFTHLINKTSNRQGPQLYSHITVRGTWFHLGVLFSWFGSLSQTKPSEQCHVVTSSACVLRRQCTD